MTSIFDSEQSADSDNDSDYEPPVKLFSEEGETLMLNCKEKTEARSKTSKIQHLSKTDFDNQLKEVKKLPVNLIKAKNQADKVYKNFLEETAAEVKLLKNECILSEAVSTEVNSSSSVDPEYNKKSCFSLNKNIPEEACETAKNISCIDNNKKYFEFDHSTNSISNLEKNSTAFPTMKRRDLKSVLGNVLKKSKKETILSVSKQDWEKFKKEEDIVDELKTYNQGKKGYLERQRFLERSDLSRFQIEREMRLSKR